MLIWSFYSREDLILQSSKKSSETENPFWLFDSLSENFTVRKVHVWFTPLHLLNSSPCLEILSWSPPFSNVSLENFVHVWFYQKRFQCLPIVFLPFFLLTHLSLPSLISPWPCFWFSSPKLIFSNMMLNNHCFHG